MSAPLWVRCGAEVAGTALLVGVGTGAIVAGANIGGVPQWVLAIAWFLAVLIPVLVFAPVSGSHINPAVTTMLAASGRFPAREAFPYLVSQLLGAFLGSGTVWLALGHGASLGATVPHGIGLPEVFLLEFGFTVLLLLTVVLLTRAGGPRSRRELLLPAIVVGLSTELIGPLTGSSLNPDRSLAPALLSGADAGLAVYVGAAFGAAAFTTGLLLLWSRGHDARRAQPRWLDDRVPHEQSPPEVPTGSGEAPLARPEGEVARSGPSVTHSNTNRESPQSRPAES